MYKNHNTFFQLKQKIIHTYTPKTKNNNNNTLLGFPLHLVVLKKKYI
jgi:hypothetical protein